MMCLERVGIHFDDMFHSINDNCTTVVKAGRIIIGGDKEETLLNRSNEVMDENCDMHYAALMAGHAISLVEGTKVGKGCQLLGTLPRPLQKPEESCKACLS